MCVSKDESILFDGEDVHLQVLKGALLSEDRYVILHTRDSIANVSRKICQNLMFVIISNFIVFSLLSNVSLLIWAPLGKHP